MITVQDTVFGPVQKMLLVRLSFVVLSSLSTTAGCVVVLCLYQQKCIGVSIFTKTRMCKLKAYKYSVFSDSLFVTFVFHLRNLKRVDVAT